jgi:hypothetical protein
VTGGRSLASILFWGAVAVLAAAHVVVAADSLLHNRLWEDEAFNLTVPRNLVAGLGYTSDGTLSGSVLTPWDIRISTGPVVLLPIAATMALGADPVLGGRAVALAFWALLLAALFLLGRRLGGRWAGLVAVAAALALDASRGVSPIQGPADVLGEIPAAALIAWTFVVLRRRPWLAGLLLGLAVQSKLIALLALPACFVWLLLAAPGGFGARMATAFRRGWPALALLPVPTLAYEATIAATLGGGYLDHLRALVRFVRSGGQEYQGTTVVDKLGALAEAWWVPAGIAVTAAVMVAILAVAAVRPQRSPEPPTEDAAPPPDGERLALIAAAAVGLLTFVGWWATATQTPLWVRHPAPGLFAFAPLLAAAAVAGIRRALAARARPRRAAGGVATAALVALLATQAGLHASSALTPEAADLASQRADAGAIAAALGAQATPLPDGYLAAHPWGAPVPVVFLTGAHIALWDAPGRAGSPRVTSRECEPVIHQGERFRLCDPE